MNDRAIGIASFSAFSSVLKHHQGTQCQAIWASYQIRKIADCACAGNAGNLFPAMHRLQRTLLVGLVPCGSHSNSARSKQSGREREPVKLLVSDPGMMHVGIANPRWRGKCSRHSRRMRNPPFYVSGKRPMGLGNSLPRNMGWPR